MNFVFAEVTLEAPTEIRVPGGRITVGQDRDNIYFGLRENCEQLLLDDVYQVMRCVAQSVVAPDASLTWRFSSLSVRCAELEGLLARWEETREPPLLSFIGLDLSDRGHTTRGMTAFIDSELAVEFREPSRTRYAARNLARLARYALMRGGLSRDESYQATDGGLMHISWSDDATASKLITISL